jgi:hypothetical protein
LGSDGPTTSFTIPTKAHRAGSNGCRNT